MIKELIKLANHLDRINLVKEANYIDALLKVATKVYHGEMNEKVKNLSTKDLDGIGRYTSHDKINEFEKTLIKIIKKLRPIVTKESINTFIKENSFELQKELKSNIDRSYFPDLAIKEFINNNVYLAILRYEEPPEEIKKKIWEYMLNNKLVNPQEQKIEDAHFWEVKEGHTSYDLAIEKGWHTTTPDGEIDRVFYGAILRYEEPPEEIKKKIWEYMLENDFVNLEEQTIEDAEFWEVQKGDTGYDLAIKEGWYTTDPDGKTDKVFYGEI